MKKLIIALFLLPVMTIAQLPKKVDLISTLTFPVMDTNQTVHSAVTDVFGLDSQDSVAFIVEYEITDTTNSVQVTTGPSGYVGQKLTWVPFNGTTPLYSLSPFLGKLKDTLSYSVAGFNGKINTTNWNILYANSTWLTAPTAGLPDANGVHIGTGLKFAFGITRMQLQLKFSYGTNSTKQTYPVWWIGRSIRAKIYKVSR